MNHAFHIIIPARMSSSRLPGKLLLEVNGQSILEHVYRQACLAYPKSLTIATDDERIFKIAQSFGANVVMTSSTHQSGTDRVAEAARLLGIGAGEIIVNVQGDEPQMPTELMVQVAGLLEDKNHDWATLYWPIEQILDWQNPNCVKVVMTEDEKALYFSRSPIPYYRERPKALPKAYRHIGLYAYRNESLQRFVQAPMSDLEQLECLEQLRALSIGMQIRLQQALTMPGQDINTLEDFERFSKLGEHCD
ncbi:MAG: 3-deoxy-manno-octulosonate cytidylyltransferase synthetase [Pseudomonadota bacterium]|nr:3-deoxy-manno-octulosonate cytidylyltransferase synthetase [Pseudomonadota bacterium]